MDETRATDVVVVGGGLAGLTAAALLGRAGRSVQVFEQASEVGGRARTQEKDGYLFNLGPHALYREGQAIRVLRELGVPFTGGIPSVSGYAVRDGRAHPFPGTPWAFLTSGLMRPAAKLEAARFLLTILAAKPEAVARQSVAEWLRAGLRYPETRLLFEALVRLSSYANAPERLSAGAAVRQLQMVLKGNVMYLHGGWQTLVDGLRQVALAHGVAITSGARVTGLELGPNTRGARLADGRLREAGAVVLAVGSREAIELIGRERAPGLAARVEQAVPMNVATLDLGLERLPRPGVPFALGVDRPLYLSVHSAAARLAPEGRALVHVARYLRPDEDAAPGVYQAELEEFMDLVQPGWRAQVTHRRFLPRLVVSNALPAAAQGGLDGRPGPEVEGVPNLYLAGDWVGRQGLLADAAVASAARCAELALRIGRTQQPRTAEPEQAAVSARAA